MPSRRRAALVLAVLALLGAASFAAALAVGSIAVPFSDVAAALLGEPIDNAAIVRELRLPRALAGFACGGLLALSLVLLIVLRRQRG